MSTPPNPPDFDKYYLLSFDDGTSLLISRQDKRKCKLIKRAVDVKKISYTDLSNAITQRVYDYHYYLANFLKTNPADSTAYNAALDQLMSVFSLNLTLFTVTTGSSPPIVYTTWAEVRAFYSEVGQTYFQGYSTHNAPNVRVRPLCHDKAAQGYADTHLIEYSRVNLGAGPVEISDVGEYYLYFAYEFDQATQRGVWRFTTWKDRTDLAYILPTPYTTPVLYQPSQPDPASKCSNK